MGALALIKQGEFRMYERLYERPDLEDNRPEGEVIGQCQHCTGDVMDYEDHYDFEGVLIHEDCVLNYFYQFKKIM